MKTLNPFSEYDLTPLHLKKAKKKAQGGVELKPPSREPIPTLPLYKPTMDTSLQYSEVNEQLRKELYPEEDNSRKIANSVYAGLTLFNALLPGDRIEEPIVHPLESYIPAQYGRGSQAISKYGGKIPKAQAGLTTGLIPKPTYDFDLYTYARNARGVDPFGIPSSQDTANYKRNMMLLFSGDKRAIDRDKKGITELGKDLNMFDMFTYGRLEDEMSAYRDAKNVMTPEQIQVELNQPLVMPPDVTRKKQYGGYGRMKMKNVNIYNGILPTPDPMAEIAQQFEESQLLNIYGGNRRRMLRDLRRGNSPIPVEMLSGENMGQQGYLQDGNFVLNQLFKSGGWIKKATDSIKRRGTEGKCTPITKPGCTGRAKALALTFKKIARNRKKD